MALAMTRPYQHQKTHVYWLRKVIPEALRPALGRREFKLTLGTKDPAEARRLSPPIITRWEAILAAARAGGSTLTQREIEALCGEWYRNECDTWGTDPGRSEDWSLYEDDLFDRVERFEDPEENAVVPIEDRLRLRPTDRTEAAIILEAHGLFADTDSVTRFAKSLFRTKIDFAAEMKRRAEGDWSPDATLGRFPPVEPRRAREAPLGVPKVAMTIEALVAAWAAETGTSGKALYDREQTAKMFAAFLGHHDAARVTADDVVRWKEARLAAGRSTKTVANDIGELRPIWAWGKVNRKLSFAENPFAGLAPRSKKGARRARDPCTEDDARKLLTAARREDDASLRWLPWVLCFTGARLGEVTQAAKEDIQREGAAGPWFIHLHAEGEGRTLKTVHSERMVPIHSALIEEGLLRHVASLPAGSPLFSDLHPDKFGTLKGTATKKHGRWVRKVVGITDQRKDPAHAWRHRFEDQARRAGLPQNVTDALLGHLNPMNESEGYGRASGLCRMRPHPGSPRWRHRWRWRAPRWRVPARLRGVCKQPDAIGRLSPAPDTLINEGSEMRRFLAGIAITSLRFTGLAAVTAVTAITSDALAAPNQYLCIVDQASGLHYDKQADAWRPQGFKGGDKYILRRLNDDDRKKHHAIWEDLKPQPTWGFFEFGDDWPQATCSDDSYGFSCERAVLGLAIEISSLRFEVTATGAYNHQGYWEHVQRTSPEDYQFQRPKGPDPVSQPDDVFVAIGKCSPF
jgi:integrase